jgi:hypothetical protein
MMDEEMQRELDDLLGAREKRQADNAEKQRVAGAEAEAMTLRIEQVVKGIIRPVIQEAAKYLSERGVSNARVPGERTAADGTPAGYQAITFQIGGSELWALGRDDGALDLVIKFEGVTKRDVLGTPLDDITPEWVRAQVTEFVGDALEGHWS